MNHVYFSLVLHNQKKYFEINKWLVLSQLNWAILLGNIGNIMSSSDTNRALGSDANVSPYKYLSLNYGFQEDILGNILYHRV